MQSRDVDPPFFRTRRLVYCSVHVDKQRTLILVLHLCLDIY